MCFHNRIQHYCGPSVGGYRVYRAKAKGAKVIVADPRKIQLTHIADIHVRQNLGSDVALVNGIMNVILSKGLHDKKYIEERTEGFEKLEELVKGYTPERVSEISGVSAEDIIRLAETYAAAERASILYTMGITQHSHGVDNVKSLANLAMITGNVGKRSAGVNPLRGQNNVQGACDMGGLPMFIRLIRPSRTRTTRKNSKQLGTRKISDKVGYTIMEMMHGLEDGSVKGMMILGENPVGSDPDSNHVKHALESAEFLAVIDIFLTDTAKLAHVVLPGASYAEKEGTFQNTERMVLRVRKAVEPVGEARPDWQIISEISTRFGLPMSYASPSEIFDEIAAVAPSYAGLNYERLDKGGIPWPCPSTDHPGTPVLHTERFTRGKGLFHAMSTRPPEELIDDEFPHSTDYRPIFPALSHGNNDAELPYSSWGDAGRAR